jgi:glycosyltransferase involved in cell wall biosynthesis
VRIAVIAPPWVAVPPPGYGGIETVVDVLARGLQGAGHDVLLYATGDSTSPVPRAWTHDEGAGVGAGGPVAEVTHVIEAYDAARDADIVHDHTVVGPLYAAGFTDVPVVTTNHGPFNPELSPLYRAVAASVPVIAISHHQASTAGDIPIAAVIHHGVELNGTAVGPGDGGYAVFLGRMNPDKGVHTAVDVARRAGVPLRIAAKMDEPAEKQYFREQVEPRLGGDIEYVGQVSGDEKAELLDHALCLLNPIAWPEPFGMVMIEALERGTPVVGTPCGAAPEIVDDGATGFLRADEDALVAALGRVGELDRAACRRAVEERFSAERMVADHVELYERVAGRGAPR